MSRPQHYSSYPILFSLPGAFLAGCISFLFFLSLNLTWRIIFLFSQSESLDYQQGGIFLKAIFLGLRLDSVISGYLTLPVLITAFLPYIGWRTRSYKMIYTAYNIVCLFLVSLMHLFDLEFFKEFGMHVNFLILHQSGNETELWSYLKSEYPIVQYFIILSLMTFIFGWIINRCSKLIQKVRSPHVLIHVTTFFIMTAGLILACRGGWQERPIDWGYAIFSDNNLANQTALNGIFFFGRSVVELSSEDHLTKIFSTYPLDEAKQTTLDILTNGEHHQSDIILSSGVTSQPYNVVIVILESFTGALCGYLNPGSTLNVTPHFDDLAENGISFTRCYANGSRSAHGISTILTGRPSLPGLPLIYQVESMSGITTIGNILGDRGYATSYYYGGDANYDNMNGFLKMNGFQQTFDQRNLPDDAEGTAWGKFDHHLFQMALDEMDQTSSPFLSVLFTTTNHQPWKIPDSYEPHIPHFPDAPFNRQGTARTMAYVDEVIHDFLVEASGTEWYPNTLFIFTSDHGLWVNRENFDNPINAQIPLVIYNPNIINNGQMIDTVTSQADILPMLLSLLNIEDQAIPIWGRNPLQTTEGFACRVVNDQIYWFEDNYLFKEILDQKKELFLISNEGNLIIEDNESMRNILGKRSRSYLQTAYFSLKEKNIISQSTKHQNGNYFVNFDGYENE